MIEPINHSIKDKTASSKPDAVGVPLQKINALRSIMKFYKDVEVAADVIRANNVPFLAKMSENTCCGTITAVDNLKCHSFEFELKNVMQSCTVRGFLIALLVVDTQFKLLKSRNFLGVALNVVFKEEYTTKVKCCHRVIK